MNNNIWKPNVSGPMDNGGARIEQKRGYCWLVDTTEQEQVLYKKQAIESLQAISSSSAMISSHSEVPSLNVSDKNVPIVAYSDKNNETISFEGQFRNSFYFGGNNKLFSTATSHDTLVAPGFINIDKKCVSFGWESSKRDENLMLTNHYYDNKDNNVLSIGQPFNKGDYKYNNNIIGNNMSIVPNYYKGNENSFSEISKPQDFKSMAPIEANEDAIVVYNEGNSSLMPVGDQNRKKGKQTIFMEYLKENYPVAPFFGAIRPKYVYEEPNASVKKRTDNFPSNVIGLLSTGILDGVPVKYVSCSRDKSLLGIIKGKGYLCSCQRCKLSKAVHSFEFELHAGSTSRHPNNHIYFESGKTIYQVVQELRNTPQDKLFEAIQNVTGSPINQENFRAWIGSYISKSIV